MIQELFGGAGLNNIGGGGERKLISIHGGNTPSPSLSPSPSPSSSTTTTTATATTTTATGLSNPENLRCPRCDSSNTKFCYYNNYNLTQPRHFCKTCRRYWTKGGALRNVPIGGGCRKNKSATVSTTSIGKTAAAKLKTAVSEIGRSGFGSGLDHEVQSSPILWGSPQNSHLLSLLRVGHQNQNPNPNPNPMLCNSLNVKEEGGMNMIGSHMMTTDQQAMSMARTLGLDPACQAPSLGLCSSFWRNNNQNQQPPHHNQQNGFVVGHEVPSNNIGLQELFQRLRSSSSGAYYSDNLNNVVMSSSSSSSSTSSILESAAPAVGGGEMGYWNPAFTAWSTDLPTTNGAYH